MSLLQAPDAHKTSKAALCPPWTGASAKPLGLQVWWCGGKGLGRRVAKRASGNMWSQLYEDNLSK